MGSTSRQLGVVTLLQFACAPQNTDVDEGAATTSTTGEPAIECVAPMQPDLAIEMLPAMLFEGAPTPFSIHETCTVTEVADGDPERLAMTCPDGLGTLEWSLAVSPPTAALADLFAVDQAVDFRYFADGANGPVDSPHQSATLRPPDEDAPLLVIANGALPGVYGSTLRTEIVSATTCDGPPGCSGIGLTHRVAIEFTLDDVGSTIVFDHNADELGPYRIRVGDVLIDESPCDVGPSAPIEFVVLRSPAQ